MTAPTQNLFTDVAASAGLERCDTLFAGAGVRVERIASSRHSSPPGFWYDQPEEEWVVVLRGSAVLEFESGERVELSEGDYLTIPSHAKHRVGETGPATIWLAVHPRGQR